MENNKFAAALTAKILEYSANNFDDNYDYLRFGPIKHSFSLQSKIRKFVILKNYVAKCTITEKAAFAKGHLEVFFFKYSSLYNLLADFESKELLIDLICYKILGSEKVKLPLSNSTYRDQLKKIRTYADKSKMLKTNILDFVLNYYDLNFLGKDVRLFFNENGIYIDFVLEQYAYKKGLTIIEAKKGDYIIDAGACWGDTALYFGDKVGEQGRVFSFEFIPANIEILEKNLANNPKIEKIVQLVKQPLWNQSEIELFYIDKGPSSGVSFVKLKNYNSIVRTISIDDFVRGNKISKIDFIKMDIEGAESKALEGAVNTIKKHKPTLAISIYHSSEDFVNIPEWIHELNLGYKLYLGHFTIHAEETVIIASTK